MSGFFFRAICFASSLLHFFSGARVRLSALSFTASAALRPQKDTASIRARMSQLVN
jgi:hypothetical protein